MNTIYTIGGKEEIIAQCKTKANPVGSQQTRDSESVPKE